MKKYELTQYEFVKVRVDHKPFGTPPEESGSFRPWSFRPNLGVGRFGLGRWVDSALCRFGPGSFLPKIGR